MHKIKDISEDEMIAVFLKGEINSRRFGSSITDYLQKYNIGRRIIDQPNFLDLVENNFRRSVIAEYRGYGINKKLFENFPSNVKWQRAFLTKHDLEKVKYINYDYWVELSSGLRLPIDAAENIKKGLEVFNKKNEQYLNAAEFFKAGNLLPEMIFVGRDDQSYLVVLEGHLRITAYMLALEFVPDKLEVIVGYSPKIVTWDMY
ncbi:MAG: hypothetical protein HY225_01015 [Candidatus Vogelbacteria bacterium]|nr:hypothetical protein [Candidatus Vogelbacteria bacterium]